MKTLSRLHRYLSCFIAPAMIFFAVSGCWQAFRLQQDHKDGYRAPKALAALSLIHKAEKLSGPTGVIFRSAQVAIGAAFVLTALVGIVMALRLTRPVWLAWLCLLAGVVVPALIALLARSV